MTDKNLSTKLETIKHLENGNISALGLVPIGSNYTFLVDVEYKKQIVKAIYKPEAGEQPLLDFPPGTLYKREYAAYLLSELLTWHFVPTTIIREGPYGIGSLQQYIQGDFETNYFTIRETQLAKLKTIAIFDIITNNADRKASHCFLDRTNTIWAIDHGLTFNEQWTLRTVIWDFINQTIPEFILTQLKILKNQLDTQSSQTIQLESMLTKKEIDKLNQRIENLLLFQRFPSPDKDRRNIPFPWF